MSSIELEPGATPAASDLPEGVTEQMVQAALMMGTLSQRSSFLGFGETTVDCKGWGVLVATATEDLALEELRLYHHGGNLQITRVNIAGLSVVYGSEDRKGFPLKALHGQGISLRGHEIRAGQTMQISLYNPTDVHGYVSAGLTGQVLASPFDMREALLHLRRLRDRGTNDEARLQLLAALRSFDTEMVAKRVTTGRIRIENKGSDRVEWVLPPVFLPPGAVVTRSMTALREGEILYVSHMHNSGGDLLSDADNNRLVIEQFTVADVDQLEGHTRALDFLPRTEEARLPIALGDVVQIRYRNRGDESFRIQSILHGRKPQKQG